MPLYALEGAAPELPDGTLIAEGKKIPDNSLVLGVPGRVVRPLSDGEIAMLRLSSEIYVQNYRRFRDSLVELRR